MLGNLTEFIDRRGQNSSFTYNDLNRLITESYQDGSFVQRAYDTQGHLKQVDDSEGGTFVFSYDAVGRLINSKGPFATIQYARDELGRVSQRQVVGQPIVTYAYDPVGNLLSVGMPQANITNSYDDRNQLLHQIRSNGVITDYTYDPIGQILVLHHSSAGKTLEEQTYTYDPVGNRISKTSTNAQALTTESSILQYATDSNLLLQRDGVSYAHDANGNRMTETDANGTTTYSWDGRNRLESIQGQGESTEFQYDFFGNLIAQSNGLTSQQMVLDVLSNLVFQNSSDGTQFSVLTGPSIDQHIGLVRPNGQVNYGLTDAINSTVMITDNSGNPIAQFHYEPYGETAVSGSNYPFQFTGRLVVRDNLSNYRARYYSHSVGRFISEDPIGIESHDINFYRYVNNNPITRIDPTGLRGTSGSGGGSAGCFSQYIKDVLKCFAFPGGPRNSTCIGDAYANLVECLFGSIPDPFDDDGCNPPPPKPCIPPECFNGV